IVAYQVPVTFFSVELHGNAADVAFCVGGTALAGHGGKSCKHRCLLADFREDSCASVWGNVMCNGEGAVSTCTFGVHAALGDYLAVEVCQFFKQPYVLQ